MTVNESIEKIRAIALTAKASIYNEDAMTAIELAGVTACKVNECIECVNRLTNLVEAMYKAINGSGGSGGSGGSNDNDSTYDPDDESIII